MTVVSMFKTCKFSVLETKDAATLSMYLILKTWDYSFSYENGEYVFSVKDMDNKDFETLMAAFPKMQISRLPSKLFS